MTTISDESTNGVTDPFEGEYQERILLKGLPIPPSSNSQYFLHRVGNKTYHIPSGEYKKFKKSMLSWFDGLPASQVFMVGRNLHYWLKTYQKLHISACFLLDPKRIYCKDGRVKKFDVSNRLKALHDEIGKLFEVDDSYFFGISAVKMPVIENQEEMVCIDIAPIS